MSKKKSYGEFEIALSTCILKENKACRSLEVPDEFRHNHGMFLRHDSGLLKETRQIVFIVSDIHRRATQHIGWANQTGIADLRTEELQI